MLALQEAGVGIMTRSSFWECEPVPPSDQPWYVNAVIQVETNLGPHALMALLLEIEQSLGRERRETGAARIIDLDLLSYDNFIMDSEDNHGRSLKLPHPRLQQRRFVLAPLTEIEPDWLHPSLQMTSKELLAALDKGGKVRKLDA